MLAAYLSDRATDLLRGLRGPETAGGLAAAEAAWLVRRSARRICATLAAHEALTDEEWAKRVRGELQWFSGLLVLEHVYAARLERLLAGLHRLTGPDEDGDSPPARAVGAARAAALLQRRLGLARSRAHTAALDAMGSERFHAAVDAVALLASEAPLEGDASPEVLRAAVERAQQQLADAVARLPLQRAGHPYNAEALARGLDPAPAPEQDTPWRQVRSLLRQVRYAHEVLAPAPPPRLLAASQALDRHRDAAQAAEAAASAAHTPRITPTTAYALGVLHADQRHEVEAARFTFGRLWERSTA
ncbi:CHAD domain-containing protein [Streptomyces sp. NPDC051940]|uniref:CHAD domain-containing protein n=1 Tax=Streptomyces sp. NPDC051940 TaxID=3155675 RepID=UPI003443E00C